MNTLEELKKFKSDVMLKMTIFWIFIVGVVLHFLVHVTIIILATNNKEELYLIDHASILFGISKI